MAGLAGPGSKSADETAILQAEPYLARACDYWCFSEVGFSASLLSRRSSLSSYGERRGFIVGAIGMLISFFT